MPSGRKPSVACNQTATLQALPYPDTDACMNLIYITIHLGCDIYLPPNPCDKSLSSREELKLNRGTLTVYIARHRKFVESSSKAWNVYVLALE
jgi:hypothetical protein